jgi:hypothetical protein
MNSLDQRTGTVSDADNRDLYLAHSTPPSALYDCRNKGADTSPSRISFLSAGASVCGPRVSALSSESARTKHCNTIDARRRRAETRLRVKRIMG